MNGLILPRSHERAQAAREAQETAQRQAMDLRIAHLTALLIQFVTQTGARAEDLRLVEERLDDGTITWRYSAPRAVSADPAAEVVEVTAP